MNICVTGGAGYIGSVVVEELIRSGHAVVVLDDMSKGHRDSVHPEAIFIEGSIQDRDVVTRLFDKNAVEAVIHMAASSLVGESVQFPEKYFQNNVVNGRALLDVMSDCGVKKMVFSSTAAVYGEPERQPIVETDRLQPTNPYGESKLAFERELESAAAVNGLEYVSLRYFNAAGGTEKCGERHNPETHLIPLILQAATGKLEHIDIFGDDYPTRDGTCVRDYIHVVDLARAHILALDILDERSAVFNLGCGGEGYTVREVIDAAREVTGLPIKENISPRRAGDPAVLIACSDRIKEELKWQPQFQDLKLIIDSAWQYAQSKSGASA